MLKPGQGVAVGTAAGGVSCVQMSHVPMQGVAVGTAAAGHGSPVHDSSMQGVAVGAAAAAAAAGQLQPVGSVAHAAFPVRQLRHCLGKKKRKKKRPMSHAFLSPVPPYVPPYGNLDVVWDHVAFLYHQTKRGRQK